MSRYVRAEASLRAARHVWRIVPSAASSLLITHLGRAAGAETMAVSVQRSLGRKRAGDRLCAPSSLEMALARSDRLETVEASPRQRCYCLFPERGAQSSQGGSEAIAPLRGIDRSTCGPNCRVAAPTNRSPHAAGRSNQTSRFSACAIAVCWLTPSSSAIITCYTARSPDLHLGGGSQGTTQSTFSYRQFVSDTGTRGIAGRLSPWRLVATIAATAGQRGRCRFQTPSWWGLPFNVSFVVRNPTALAPEGGWGGARLARKPFAFPG
jgi:hypothetical protein